MNLHVQNLNDEPSGALSSSLDDNVLPTYSEEAPPAEPVSKKEVVLKDTPSELVNCAYFTNLASYKFNSIMDGPPEGGVDNGDQQIMVQSLASEGTVGGYSAHFNFCESKITNLVNDNCKGDEEEGALGYIYNGTTCTSLQTNLVSLDVDIPDPTAATPEPQGLSLILAGENESVCPKATYPDGMKLTVNVHCDKEATVTVFNKEASKMSDPCDVQLDYTAK